MIENEHPIERLMTTAMDSIKDMIDVNTIIGNPIQTPNDIVIIPISKVSFGFAAGGSEFKGETINEYKKQDKDESIQYKLPFGGGSGAGVSINPVAFIVVEGEKVKLLPVSHASCMDKIIDYVPELLEKLTNQKKNEQEGNKINKENNISREKTKPKKPYIHKVPETTEQNMKYQKNRPIRKSTKTQQELEEFYEDEYNYFD